MTTDTVDTSVGVSNTAGYSYTGGDPTITDIPGVGEGFTAYTPMTGGGKRSKGKGNKRGKGKKRGRSKKTKMRRSISKRIKAMSKNKVRSMKKFMKKRTHKKHHKRRLKHRSARQDVIKSIESGLPVPKESSKQLTPSMQSFLAGIESGTTSGSVIKFSDFKSDPGKKKNKKNKKKKKKKKKKGGFFSWF